MHCRFEKVKHAFTYPVYFYAFELDELEELDADTRLFAYNRKAVISLYDKDYLMQGEGSLKENLVRYLEENDYRKEVTRVELITSARFLGHAFNPVSFFYCYGVSGELEVIVAQVRNTFKEMHLYICDTPQHNEESNLRCYKKPKEFHVSPFFDRSGAYEFKFSAIDDELEIHIDLVKEGQVAITTSMKGAAQEWSVKNLTKTILRFPLNVFLTLPRIHWQAAKLHFKKKLPVYKKPVADSDGTIRVAQITGIQSMYKKLIYSFFAKFTKGHLLVTEPDGTEAHFGDTDQPVTAELFITHYRFFRRVVFSGSIGFGEAFQADECRSPNMASVLELFVDNQVTNEKKPSKFSIIAEKLNRWRHERRSNCLMGSSKNIMEHYDLGNDFYELFLDESMTYSCGVYKRPEDSLFQAQQNKLQMMIDKADIQASDHILEIGFGWGALSIKAAKEKGCRVTGITLSQEQLAYATALIKQEGLEDQINLKLCDYRKLEGCFDKIVSVEMLEAVGHEYYPGFFNTVDRLLAPGGRAVIQSITIPDERYAKYLRGCDWIQKYIFPGGHLPCEQILEDVIAEHTTMRIDEIDRIGPHYATTLKEWKELFEARREEVKALGFDEYFMRTWHYYFAYCEAGFRAGAIDDIQFVVVKNA